MFRLFGSTWINNLKAAGVTYWVLAVTDNKTAELVRMYVCEGEAGFCSGFVFRGGESHGSFSRERGSPRKFPGQGKQKPPRPDQMIHAHGVPVPVLFPVPVPVRSLSAYLPP